MSDRDVASQTFPSPLEPLGVCRECGALQPGILGHYSGCSSFMSWMQLGSVPYTIRYNGTSSGVSFQMTYGSGWPDTV